MTFLLPVGHPQIKHITNGFTIGAHQRIAPAHRSHTADGQLGELCEKQLPAHTSTKMSRGQPQNADLEVAWVGLLELSQLLLELLM